MVRARAVAATATAAMDGNMKTRNNLLALLLGIVLTLDVGLHVYNPLARAQNNQPPLATLSAVTTGTGTSITCSNAIQVGWSILWSAGVSDGEVVIEAANASNYSGTWAEIDRQNFSTAPAANSMISGTYPGPFQFVRARVTSAVVGGTVTVTINRINGSN